MNIVFMIFIFMMYAVFYFVLGNILVTSFLFGRVSGIAILGLIFVTVHMILMAKSLGGKRKSQKEQAYKPIRQERTNVSTIEDTCTFEHDISDYDRRFCPFCGKEVKHSAAKCPHCNHEI